MNMQDFVDDKKVIKKVKTLYTDIRHKSVPISKIIDKTIEYVTTKYKSIYVKHEENDNSYVLTSNKNINIDNLLKEVKGYVSELGKDEALTDLLSYCIKIYSVGNTIIIQVTT